LGSKIKYKEAMELTKTNSNTVEKRSEVGKFVTREVMAKFHLKPGIPISPSSRHERKEGTKVVSRS
jgi:hypothetical protein